jgi:hypothetical protein
MLDYARERARQVLKIPRTAVLATDGPAGLQLSELPCEALGLEVYLLLPQTSDHAFNLEHNPAVTLLTAAWKMQGKARIASKVEEELELLRRPEGAWSVLVQVAPARIHILGDRGWGNAETIDLSI